MGGLVSSVLNGIHIYYNIVVYERRVFILLSRESITTRLTPRSVVWVKDIIYNFVDGHQFYAQETPFKVYYSYLVVV